MANANGRFHQPPIREEGGGEERRGYSAVYVFLRSVAVTVVWLLGSGVAQATTISPLKLNSFYLDPLSFYLASVFCRCQFLLLMM